MILTTNSIISFIGWPSSCSSNPMTGYLLSADMSVTIRRCVALQKTYNFVRAGDTRAGSYRSVAQFFNTIWLNLTCFTKLVYSVLIFA